MRGDALDFVGVDFLADLVAVCGRADLSPADCDKTGFVVVVTVGAIVGEYAVVECYAVLGKQEIFEFLGVNYLRGDGSVLSASLLKLLIERVVLSVVRNVEIRSVPADLSGEGNGDFDERQLGGVGG